MTLAQERDRRRKLWKAEYKANASKIQRDVTKIGKKYGCR